jgi:hypothetical protein
LIRTAGAYSNHRPRSTSHQKNQPTVKYMQSINSQLQPRESSTGDNYAAYMYHGMCTSFNRQPSSFISNHQHISRSAEQLYKTNSFDRKTTKPQPVTSYRKRRLACLNIFRAKTRIQPTSSPHPPASHSQTFTNAFTHTHAHTSLINTEAIEGRRNNALTLSQAPTSRQLPAGGYSVACNQAHTQS